MSIEQKMYTETMFQVELQSMSNAMFAGENSGTFCLTLIFNLNYLKIKFQHAKLGSRFQDKTKNRQFSFED